MKRFPAGVPCALIAALLMIAASILPNITAASADSNWPQWRGPESQGISMDKDLPAEWSSTRNIKWKAPIAGRGHSSPIIWGTHVFLTTAIEGAVVPGAKAATTRSTAGLGSPDSVGADASTPSRYLAGSRQAGAMGATAGGTPTTTPSQEQLRRIDSGDRWPLRLCLLRHWGSTATTSRASSSGKPARSSELSDGHGHVSCPLREPGDSTVRRRRWGEFVHVALIIRRARRSGRPAQSAGQLDHARARQAPSAQSYTSGSEAIISYDPATARVMALERCREQRDPDTCGDQRDGHVAAGSRQDRDGDSFGRDRRVEGFEHA